MMYRFILVLSVLVLSACSSTVDKKFVRINSTEFETEQSMNQTANVHIENEDLLISICSEFGCTDYTGKNIGDVFVIDGFNIQVKGDTLTITPQDSDADFIFKEIQK